jgi:putative addiction module component (TIGR02574 family)
MTFECGEGPLVDATKVTFYVAPMGTTDDDVVAAALSLPPEVRAMLAEQLLESLDDPVRARIDAVWALEVEKRAAQIEDGKVEALPGKALTDELPRHYPEPPSSALFYTFLHTFPSALL